MARPKQHSNGNGHKEKLWKLGGAVAILLAICGFLFSSWMKTQELNIIEAKRIADLQLAEVKKEIAEIERETASTKLALQTERGRVDSLQTSLGSVTGVMDRIDGNVRSIDSRLSKFEFIVEDYRRKNTR